METSVHQPDIVHESVSGITMVETVLPSGIAVIVTLSFLEHCFRISQVWYLQAVVKYVPLPKLGKLYTKSKDVFMLFFITKMNYENYGWASVILAVPAMMKWRWNVPQIEQDIGTQTDGNDTGSAIQQGRQLINGGQQGTYFGSEQIDLEAEKQKSYVKSVRFVYDDLSDEELLQTLKYLQKKNVPKVDGIILGRAIQYLRSKGQSEETVGELVSHDHTQQPALCRQKLVQILMESGFDDAEDVIARYERKYGCPPTKEEFVEFYETLRGIGDLEKKLARASIKADEEKRKAEIKDRLVQEKDRQVQEKDRQVQEEKRKAEIKDRQVQEKDRQVQEKDRQVQEEKRKAEIKDRQVQEKDRQVQEEKRKADKAAEEKKKADDKVRDLEMKAQRSLCKLCMTEEVSVLSLPCGHLYCCGQCANLANDHGKCHMCDTIIVSQLPIMLS